MSIYPNDRRTPAEQERDAARLNEAVAEDVAVTEAVRAERERERANTYAAVNAQQAANLNDVRRERDYAHVSGAVARDDARSNAFAFWLLLGTLLVALTVWGVWYANRPEPTASTTVINREVVRTEPATGTSNAASAAQPPAVVTPAAPTVVVPAPAPAPVVVERPVAVPVPVPQQNTAPALAPTAAPQPASEAAPATAPATAPQPANSEEPLRGYTVPE